MSRERNIIFSSNKKIQGLIYGKNSFVAEVTFNLEYVLFHYIIDRFHFSNNFLIFQISHLPEGLFKYVLPFCYHQALKG